VSVVLQVRGDIDGVLMVYTGEPNGCSDQVIAVFEDPAVQIGAVIERFHSQR
jgi:hypothetical protein